MKKAINKIRYNLICVILLLIFPVFFMGMIALIYYILALLIRMGL